MMRKVIFLLLVSLPFAMMDYWVVISPIETSANVTFVGTIAVVPEKGNKKKRKEKKRKEKPRKEKKRKEKKRKEKKRKEKKRKLDKQLVIFLFLRWRSNLLKHTTTSPHLPSILTLHCLSVFHLFTPIFPHCLPLHSLHHLHHQSHYFHH